MTICGAPTNKGGVCQRNAKKDHARCYQHVDSGPVDVLPTTKVDLDDVIVVGDVRGDPLVLLRIFKMSGVFEGLDWELCESTVLSLSVYEEDYPQKLFDQLRWKKDANVMFVFLGNLVDTASTSYQPSVPMGSEELVMRTLVRLKKSAPHLSDIMWVLGSHDMANAINDIDGFCIGNAHQKYCDIDNGRFSVARVKWINECMAKMKPHAIIVFDGMVFSHGSITSLFLARYNQSLKGNALVMEINRDYQKALADARRPKRIDSYENVPPDGNDGPTDIGAITRLEAEYMFSGQQSMPDRREKIIVKSINGTGPGAQTEVSSQERPMVRNSHYIVAMEMARVFGDSTRTATGYLHVDRRGGTKLIRAVYY